MVQTPRVHQPLGAIRLAPALSYFSRLGIGIARRRKVSPNLGGAIPEDVRQLVVDTALQQTVLSLRELACRIADCQGYFISESSVCRILKAYDLIARPAYVVISAADSFKNPTRRVNELRQTLDLSQSRRLGWSYPCTVLDDFSRFILAWKLFTTMGAKNLMETLDPTLAEAGIDQIKVRRRPRLLSSNGPCYVASELRFYLKDKDIEHICSAPYHPMTQGKIERYCRTRGNVIKLKYHCFPSHLEHNINGFVDYYNYQRYHKALNNVMPADIFFGRHPSDLINKGND